MPISIVALEAGPFYQLSFMSLVGLTLLRPNHCPGVETTSVEPPNGETLQRPFGAKLSDVVRVNLPPSQLVSSSDTMLLHSSLWQRFRRNNETYANISKKGS